MLLVNVTEGCVAVLRLLLPEGAAAAAATAAAMRCRHSGCSIHQEAFQSSGCSCGALGPAAVAINRASCMLLVNVAKGGVTRAAAATA
jgi:hypothetical protein